MASNCYDESKISNGIELCEDKCFCGGTMRLHTFTFKDEDGNPKTRHYVDCDKYCGRVSDWHDTADEAIESFDNEYGNDQLVSEST